MRLFLMRHAETEIGAHKSDIERELTIKGQGEAEEAAKFLTDYQIDKIIVSYVTRTRQTAAIILNSLSIKAQEITQELYKNDEHKVITLIAAQPKAAQNILILGHNPTIHKVITSIVKPNDNLYDYLLETIMPPARIVVVEFASLREWQEIKDKRGEIISVFTPSENLLHK